MIGGGLLWGGVRLWFCYCELGVGFWRWCGGGWELGSLLGGCCFGGVVGVVGSLEVFLWF